MFKRGKKLAELEIPSGMTETVKQLLVFGLWIIGCCTTRIEVWRSTTYEHYTTISSVASRFGYGKSLLSGVMCTMPTFLNKILLGKTDGSVELWNVSTG